MSIHDILNLHLVGNFISFFSVGDSWTMNIGAAYLVAQDILFTDEEIFNNFIEENYPMAKSTVDRENISKCAVLAANMRKSIIRTKIDSDCSLHIHFENGSPMVVTTNTPVVDWQWALTLEGKDPYRGHLISCFWEGEIVIGEQQAT